MQFGLSTASLMAIMATLSLSTASPVNTTSWPVSNFNVGCSPAACVYNFNVTRLSGPSNPGFSTGCTGNDFTSDFQPCDDPSITARIVPKEDPYWEVDVNHTYADANGGSVVASANATVVDKTTSFVVSVYEVSEN